MQFFNKHSKHQDHENLEFHTSVDNKLAALEGKVRDLKHRLDERDKRFRVALRYLKQICSVYDDDDYNHQ
jgi:hypothetical protein